MSRLPPISSPPSQKRVFRPTAIFKKEPDFQIPRSFLSTVNDERFVRLSCSDCGVAALYLCHNFCKVAISDGFRHWQLGRSQRHWRDARHHRKLSGAFGFARTMLESEQSRREAEPIRRRGMPADGAAGAVLQSIDPPLPPTTHRPALAACALPHPSCPICTLAALRTN